MYEDKQEVRVEALKLALEQMRGQSLTNSTDEVVKAAEKFEKFILGEEKKPFG